MCLKKSVNVQKMMCMCASFRSNEVNQLISFPDRFVEASVSRALRVPDVAIRVEPPRWVSAEYTVWLFRTAFIADVREEALLDVVVDCSTGRLVRRWEELRTAGRFVENPPHDPVLTALDLRAAYQMAQAEALRNLSSQVTQRQRHLLDWKQREALRVTRYHEELDEELAERARKERQDIRRQALLARIGANRLEARRAAQDLEAHATLSVELECASLLLVEVSKALVTCHLHHPKRLWQTQVEMLWNLASRAAEAINCSGCGQPGFTFDLRREGLACLRCLKPAT
jgi:hypothetical protein